MYKKASQYCVIACVIAFWCFGADRATAQAQRAEVVRVYNWWLYIDVNNPVVRDVEKRCNVSINVDKFYSAKEFLSTMRDRAAYDILIYPHTAYREISSGWLNKDSPVLLDRIKEYHPIVRSLFEKNEYAKNTQIMIVALTGFLVNRGVISVKPGFHLKDALASLDNQIFAVLDDHIEIADLMKKASIRLNKGERSSPHAADFFSIDQFGKLLTNSKLVVASDIAVLANHPQFALAYTWQGEAFQQQNRRPSLEFVVDPWLSNINIDLITLVGKSRGAKCVADELTSKSFINESAKRWKYFSPYGKISLPEADFLALQNRFFDGRLNSLSLTPAVSSTESIFIEKRWEELKIRYGRRP